MDQTASGSDQTSSDADQKMAERDQAASDADQRASDRDQALADLVLEGNRAVEPEVMRAYEEARASRAEGTMARLASTALRAQIASERHVEAGRRDQTASGRDGTATVRDQEAEDTDMDNEPAAGLDEEDPLARTAAADSRASAARGRERAATDRDSAEHDRELQGGEIERSYMDEPSGAFGRQIGEVLLRHEVERAEGIEGTLTLGLIAVSPITQIEERHNGDPARVTRDRNLFLALRAALRPYDPIVRWDRTTFLCALSEVPPVDAESMFGKACASIAELHPEASIGFGVASMEAGDTIKGLVERASKHL